MTDLHVVPLDMCNVISNLGCPLMFGLLNLDSMYFSWLMGMMWRPSWLGLSTVSWLHPNPNVHF